MNNDPIKISGPRRAAILLLALEEDSAAEVFKHLSAREVQDLGQEMASLGQVSHAEMRQVLDAFHAEAEEYAALNLHTSDHIRAILTKALGSERASSLIEDILEHSGTNSGIDALNIMDPTLVTEMIREEHPQIIATILVHLERRQAADILELFDEKLRNERYGEVRGTGVLRRTDAGWKIAHYSMTFLVPNERTPAVVLAISGKREAAPAGPER